ncbi:MAG TPA: DUF4124 domain-containing protein [Stenotrophobium sp.]|jgi:hypothetical protein|nr:DUF4124 domain-containing protein [Stenotrophobium sp.]
MRRLACLLLMMTCLPALAGTVYRYVDKNGEVHFTDHPPSGHAQPFRLEQDLGLAHDPRAASPPLRSPPFGVRFNTPSPGQAYPAAGDIRVSVSVMPGLAKGFGIVFRVDGQPQNRKPVPDIRTVLKGIPAGTHEITAALIGPLGMELARSAPISIHVGPAAAPMTVSRTVDTGLR